MKFFFSLPGFGDPNYREVLSEAGAREILMSYFYTRLSEPPQFETYVKQGHKAERSLVKAE